MAAWLQHHVGGLSELGRLPNKNQFFVKGCHRQTFTEPHTNPKNTLHISRRKRMGSNAPPPEFMSVGYPLVKCMLENQTY